MRAQHKSPGALPASSIAFLCNPIYLVLCPLHKKETLISLRADLGWAWDPYSFYDMYEDDWHGVQFENDEWRMVDAEGNTV